MAFHAPEDVAAVLKIKPSTLRKYSLLLESNGYTFQKNSQGHRWFSDTDIAALKKLITLKDSTDMSLEDSAQAVFLWAKGGDIASIDTTQAATQDVIEYSKRMTPEHLYNALQEQERMIQRMSDMLEQQAQDNAAIMDELRATRTVMDQLQDKQQLPEPEQQDTRSLWARIWNK